ncbi:Helitron helicase-like domain - like 1 [Theobroma cacao]|nr:Helitron helicase-like domain - like 1 [Theobroma cacao]
MQYPLLFPYGEDGFTLDINYIDSPSRKKPKQKYVTMREYYAYIIQQRSTYKNTLLRGGRLLQQFIVDTYAIIEEEILLFIRNNQKQLRAELYKGLKYAFARGDNNANTVGKRIVLPSSFTGSPRYLLQNHQDSMAICRYYGCPDLFITFTCNANWKEIQDALNSIPNQKAEDRPDITSRVFKIKLLTYTIEFKKRGLPHVHILLWLHHDSKCSSPDDVDKIITAELPHKFLDPTGYKAVAEFMIHGPCGLARPTSSCMIKGFCSKYYPKDFETSTTINEDGFLIYRIRDIPNCVTTKNNIKLDNQYVVPHNRDLIVKYQAQINVEICGQSRAIKYLFKYINKGLDRARVILENKNSNDQAHNSNANFTSLHKQQQEDIEVDEIKTYLDCRYLSAYEACWRLFAFPIHHREPVVQRLVVHLPEQQNIYFHDHETISGVIHRPDITKTTFTEWMTCNQNDQNGHHLLYVDFPTEYVWHEQ